MPRMTIEFTKQVDDLLKELAKRNNTTKVDVLRRALSLYHYAKNETSEKKQKLSITDEEDRIIKDLIFQ